jgi:hypothetical protein
MPVHDADHTLGAIHGTRRATGLDRFSSVKVRVQRLTDRPPVLILYHLDSDPPEGSKLLPGIIAQRLTPDPSLDGSQQRGSEPVGKKRVQALTASHGRPRMRQQAVYIVLQNDCANGDTLIANTNPRVVPWAHNEFRYGVLRFIAKRTRESAPSCGCHL